MSYFINFIAKIVDFVSLVTCGRIHTPCKDSFGQEFLWGGTWGGTSFEWGGTCPPWPPHGYATAKLGGWWGVEGPFVGSS